MGLHYSERTYYDDPDENDHFVKYYGCNMYCKHNPNQHPSYLLILFFFLYTLCICLFSKFSWNHIP